MSAKVVGLEERIWAKFVEGWKETNFSTDFPSGKTVQILQVPQLCTPPPFFFPLSTYSK
jgi:hypothetical protein